MTRHTVRAKGIEATLNLDVGMVDRLVITCRGRQINPWARAPWYGAAPDDPRFGPDLPPHLRHLSAEFFCAPFSRDDKEGAPLHGWPANSRWDVAGEDALPNGRRVTFRLRRRLAGATLEKQWTLLDDHPFLYQCHRFTGGTQAISVAHHAMIDLRSGGRLAFSPKAWAETPDIAPETNPAANPDAIPVAATGNTPAKGGSVLHYPRQTRDMTRFPGRDGAVDLTRYPFADNSEDFAMLVDAPSGLFGWASVQRPANGDLALLIKPVDVLPQTMLWMSNGGRSHAPWNGEHHGILGIEEACSFGGAGWAGSVAENRLSRQGIPTAIDLAAAPVVEIRTAMGAIAHKADGPVPIEISTDAITLPCGAQIPFAARLVV